MKTKPVGARLHLAPRKRRKRGDVEASASLHLAPRERGEVEARRAEGEGTPLGGGRGSGEVPRSAGVAAALTRGLRPAASPAAAGEAIQTTELHLSAASGFASLLSGSGALLRLLHLASPALPIGAFAYSQGLEPAVEARWVHDEASAASWIVGLMGHTLATLEVPLLWRLHAAWTTDDPVQVRRWSDFALAARGSQELQAEDRRMGAALARVLTTLEIADASAWGDDSRVTYISMFALACARWSITPAAGAHALLFAWAENQAAAAMRLVPLGQSAGLRIVARCSAAIPAIVAQGLALPDDDLALGAPAHVLGSAHHETQYSRLFRS